MDSGIGSLSLAQLNLYNTKGFNRQAKSKKLNLKAGRVGHGINLIPTGNKKKPVDDWCRISK